MKARVFLKLLEHTFGQYLPGMREAVDEYLQRVDERLLDQLYRKLLNEHEDHWPPPLAKLRRLLGELGSQPPPFKLLGAPPMCSKDRAAGLHSVLDVLKELAEKKRMPKPQQAASSERSDIGVMK